MNIDWLGYQVYGTTISTISDIFRRNPVPNGEMFANVVTKRGRENCLVTSTFNCLCPVAALNSSYVFLVRAHK
jgi:hypothetical protein